MPAHPVRRILLYLLASFALTHGFGLALSGAGLADPLLLPFLGITAATILACRALDRRPLKDLGLSLNRRTAPDLALGLLLPPVLLGAVLACEWAAGWTMVVQVNPLRGSVLAGLILRLALVAWYEELAIRGYLLQELSRVLPAWAANLIAALFFAGLHAMNPHASPAAVSGVALAGLALGSARLATRALFLPIAFHFSWNLSLVLLGYPVSGIVMPGLLRLVRAGPSFFTGGGFGPEAGLSGAAAFMAAFCVFLGYAGFRASAKPAAT